MWHLPMLEKKKKKIMVQTGNGVPGQTAGFIWEEWGPELSLLVLNKIQGHFRPIRAGYAFDPGHFNSVQELNLAPGLV